MARRGKSQVRTWLSCRTRLMKGWDLGQTWKLAKVGGIDDRGEVPLLVVVKYTQPGPWLVCLARSAPCETDKGAAIKKCGASCFGPVLESVVLDDRYSSTRRRRSNRGEN